MFKKILFSFFSVALLVSCGNDVPTVSNAEPVGERPVASKEGKPTDALAAIAVPDTDLHGKIKWCLTALQEEYAKAEGKVPGVGKVTVLLDDNLTLIIRNDLNGSVSEKKVNMKDLEPDPKKYEFIVDAEPGQFPGVKIPVIDGRPKVEISKGSSSEEADKLEIILAERDHVERVLTAFLQAIQILQGKYDS